jgi:translocation and assembly module TamB
MALRTAFLDVAGNGDVDRGIDWTGTLDLAGLRRQLDQIVDFGDLQFEGKGPVSGRYRRIEAAYAGNMDADLRAVRFAGLGLNAFERDQVRLSFSVGGPCDSLGIPEGWRSVRVEARGGDASAEFTADATPTGKTYASTIATPVRLGGRDRRAEARLDARWDKSDLAIDRLAVILTTGDDKAKSELIGLKAKGTFDPVKGNLVLKRSEGDVSRQALALSSEGVRASGIGHHGEFQFSAGLVGDVGALVRAFAGHDQGAADNLVGSWSARADGKSSDDGLRILGRLDLNDLSFAKADQRAKSREGPVGLRWAALVPKDSTAVEVAEIVVTSPYATLQGAGRVAIEKGRQLVDLHGELAPDWTAINAKLAERVEPNAQLSGKTRAWYLKGPLNGDSDSSWPKGLEGEFGFDLVDVDIYGLHLGPTPIVVRARQGKLAIGVIDTTLNGGRIRLEPTLINDDHDGLAIRLGPGSSITDAQINDEVSRRFLSYVAPVLDSATRVNGRVSVAMDEATFPLSGGTSQSASVDGSVIFQGVEFAPGPFMDVLYDAIGRQDRPTLKLNEPIALRIADRRVYQQGLAIPLGRLTQIELDGWVDFDRNIALTASVPVTPAMFGNNPVLGAIVEGTKIKVPIRGTLRKPEIDRDAMNVAMKDLGRTLLERGATQGVVELLQRLTRPRDPNAPPPITRQERRAKRQERRAERRRERGLEP